MINKLSPELQKPIHARKAREAATEPSTAVPIARDPGERDRSAQGPAERTEILVEFTGDIADLTAIGFEPRSVIEHPQEHHRIATGTIPANQLEALAAIPHVVEVEGSQRYGQHLNYSLPEIHGNVIQSGTPSRKGRGVVVGIIDSGVDWRHGSFVDWDDRTSRILSIWDQSITNPATSETVGQGGLGVVYSNDEISRALRGTAIVRARDGAPHGTHVAGIAAGNGAPAACCHPKYTYTGVAPEAELIVVRLNNSNGDGELGENIRLVDALNYIFNHPAAAGKPVVINISLGQNRGPHDGTALVERTIDALVATPARAVVVAAGNHANKLCHVTATVPVADDLEFEFAMPEGRDDEVWLDLWYERLGALNIEVVAPNGTTSGTVNEGVNHNFVANPLANARQRSTVYLTSRILNPHNRDNNWRINIDTPQSGNIPHDTWKIKLTNPTMNPVRFHCWIERGDPAPKFLKPVTPPDGKLRASSDSTVSTPATAAGAITVANHATKTDCCDCHPLGGVLLSSGEGPVARGAATNPKPDIAAPGLLITSAKADARNFPGHCCWCCPDACCCLYEDMTGTSMAAPHVTGTIALMLEENPRLTKDEILRYLRASATPPPPGGRPEVWGAGKLNAQRAVEVVRGGGGGGGGPPPRLPFDPAGETFSRGRIPMALRILRARMQALPEGIELAAAVSRHFSEVRRLINTNRRVAAMWHRAAGPALLRRLCQGVLNADATPAIADGPDQAYFDRWCDLLTRYGSPRLRAGLARYRPMMLALLRTPLAARIAAPAPIHA